jgi:hypothetical protein
MMRGFGARLQIAAAALAASMPVGGGEQVDLTKAGASPIDLMFKMPELSSAGSYGRHRSGNQVGVWLSHPVSPRIRREVIAAAAEKRARKYRARLRWQACQIEGDLLA